MYLKWSPKTEFIEHIGLAEYKLDVFQIKYIAWLEVI